MVCQWWPRGLRYIRCNTSGAGICRVSSKDDETLEARLLGISVFSDRGGFFWAVYTVELKKCPKVNPIALSLIHI